MNLVGNISYFVTRNQNHVGPVTLNSDFNGVTKFLCFTIMSIFGSIGNIFLISSVMIEYQLNHTGNAFIANTALADLLITILVIPSSVVAIMAKLSDSSFICKSQLFLSITSLFVLTISLFLIAVENRFRLRTLNATRLFTSLQVSFIILSVWFMSLSLSSLQFVYMTNTSYCSENSNDFIPIHIVVMVGILATILFLAILIYLCTIFQYHKEKVISNMKNNQQILCYELMCTNFFNLLFSVVMWLPFGTVLILGAFQELSNKMFYNLAWLALSKSCFNHVVYCTFNRYFRNAFVNLFYYSCCKSSVVMPNRRPLRNTSGCEGSRSKSDVRVHIIPGYNIYSSSHMPQRDQRSGYYRAPHRDFHDL